ncbi:membrane hypothetical protein [Candidatus Zixiibacteriota bacterium]|nr:membrane hypothetical protein [candidate division Zixibacteria bacterium]
MLINQGNFILSKNGGSESRGPADISLAPFIAGKLVKAVLIQICLDIVLFIIFKNFNLPANAAQICSFGISLIVLMFILFIAKVFVIRAGTVTQYILISLSILFLRSGLFSLAIYKCNLPLFLSIIPASLGGAVVLYTGIRLLAAGKRNSGLHFNNYGDWLIASLIFYLLALRLVYIGQVGLIPEETYYWNYSRHPDWGYLDHPPMVAWLIKLGTILFGHSEIGVRAGALASWAAAAFFVYRLTADWFNRRAALVSTLLLSILPFFFGIGAIMTPDAPLTAFWAGGLFFIQRALLAEKKYGWWLSGICLGLGMLSKYTMALLGPAVLIYVLFEPHARKWLKRPEPYLALAVAGLLFAPVIYWNSQNGWVSFLFQTSRRIGESIHFSPHLLLGSILFLITPFGLYGAGQVIFSRESRLPDVMGYQERTRHFVTLMIAVPLTVFFTFSLTHQPKLNWTGPLWLAIIPGLSAILARLESRAVSRAEIIIRKGWIITVVVFTLLYGGLLNYLTPGFPGLSYPKGISDVAGWPDLGAKMAVVAEKVERESGEMPLVAGMDKYNIASELAFYNSVSGPQYTTGSHLFGFGSLMYAYWNPPESCTGKTIIMVARNEDQLQSKVIEASFGRLDSTQAVPVSLNSREIRSYYWRIGYDYHPIKEIIDIYENSFPGNLRKIPR